MAQLDITSTFRWEGKNGALVVVGGEVDTTGSIPRYQLPSGNMDLLCFWNASTNSPYLYNSVGTSGDVYKCNYAGTVDLGAGPINFSSGDLIYYDGFVWGRISSNAISSIYAINNYSFTATGGQTVYTFNYVPNQLSVYYNGSKLSKNQYDASGGSYITLNFSPIAGDIITVDAYVNSLASNITGGGVNGAITKWIGTNVLTSATSGVDYVIPAALNAYVPTFRQLTINGVSYDLTADRSWNITSMVYPSAGIPISTGSAWGASIVDNSTNWNTAYTNRITSLTTTGTSGFATLSGNVLNIPNYSLNLTGYVPYTGATTNVNLGSNNIYANAFFGGFLNITASGTQVVLTVLSAPKILVSGSGGQTIKLPDATTLPNGATYSFNNNQTTGAITVNNNSNTLIVSIPSGGYAEVILLDNSIAAGSWDRHFQAPANVSWSTNTFDYAGSITSATWNGATIAINRGGTGATTAGAALTNLGGQPLATNLTSLSGLTYASTSFVKMTASGTFNLDTNTYQGALTLTTTGSSGAATLVGNTLNIPQYSGGGGITGTGSTNTLPKFTGSTAIGNSNITDSGSLITLGSTTLITGSTTASGAIARGTNLTPTLVAAANSDVLVGLDINPTFTNGAFTGVTNYGIRTSGQMYVSNSTFGFGIGNAAISTNGGIYANLLSTFNSSVIIAGTHFNNGGFSNGLLIGGTSSNTTITSVRTVTLNVPNLSATSVTGTEVVGLQMTGNFTKGTGTTVTYAKLLDLTSITGGVNNTIINIGNTAALTLQTTGNWSIYNSSTYSNYFAGVLNIGSTTLAGFQLDVTGTSRLNGQTTLTGSVTAASALAQGIIATPTLVAAANSDVLVGLDVTPTFTIGAFTPVQTYGIRTSGNIKGSNFNTVLASNPTQSYITIIGNGVAPSNTAQYNILIGGQNNGSARITAQAITSGGDNIIIGNGAGSYITTGANNVGIGSRALDGNSTTQANNVAVGLFSLLNNTGSTNTALGSQSGFNITSGGGNVFLGYNSGRYQADGSTVLALTGNNNIYIGQSARGFNNSDTNIIVIGNTAIGLGSNTTVIGNSSTTQTALFGSLTLGTTTATATALLSMSSTTQGFLPPVMTTTQKNAITSPATGLVVFDSTLGKLCVFSTTWQTITSV